jgi:SAM-dependent methyltransferase
VGGTIITVTGMFDPARSRAFGDDPETYDRARPGYPAAVFDLVLSDAPATAVDVGCGTGKAAREVMQRNVAVLGVEPDARMAAGVR